MMDGPVVVSAQFRFTIPKSVRKGTYYVSTGKDVDKLARALLDALTGVAFANDSRV